jgi:hypothetical protein
MRRSSATILSKELKGGDGRRRIEKVEQYRLGCEKLIEAGSALCFVEWPYHG